MENLTVVQENHPAHDERRDPPTLRDLVDDLRTWKVGAQHGIDISHSKHEGKSQRERGDEADGHS